MMNKEYKDNLIDCLVLTSCGLFHNINKNLTRLAATKFVNSNEFPSNNILINHGKFIPITVKMLLKYRLVTQQQIDDKLYTNE